jgi:hypothetical protein
MHGMSWPFYDTLFVFEQWPEYDDWEVSTSSSPQTMRPTSLQETVDIPSHAYISKEAEPILQRTIVANSTNPVHDAQI